MGVQEVEHERRITDVASDEGGSRRNAGRNTSGQVIENDDALAAIEQGECHMTANIPGPPVTSTVMDQTNECSCWENCAREKSHLSIVRSRLAQSPPFVAGKPHSSMKLNSGVWNTPSCPQPFHRYLLLIFCGVRRPSLRFRPRSHRRGNLNEGTGSGSS